MRRLEAYLALYFRDFSGFWQIQPQFGQFGEAGQIACGEQLQIT